jgi:hypothetical protein
MNDSEELIEKVLAGLRNVDPSPGMEHRILAAVQDHASAPSRYSWRKFVPIWLVTQALSVTTRPVAYGLALAGIVVLSLAVPAIYRHEHVPTQSKNIPAPLRALPPASSEVAVKSAQPLEPQPSVRRRIKVNPRRAELASADDSLAMREMRAPSRPAPPLPLTEQEKLLLRFVHTHSAEELAALDPVKWAVRDAKERAEFDKFFGLSTKKGNE